MDVISLARILLRRWYVLLPVLVITAVALSVVYLQSTPVYSSTGSLLFADPSMQSLAEREGEGTSAGAVASPAIIAAVVQDAEIQERVLDAGGSSEYNVTAADGGVMQVNARANSGGAAVQTVELLLQEVGNQIALRQDEAGIPEDERFSVEILSTPSTAIEVDAGDEEEEATFQAVGSLRVIGDLGRENPYANSMFAYSVLREISASPAEQQAILEAGLEGSFELTMDEAPIARITASSPDPEQVEEVYATAVERLSGQLEDRQDRIGIPAGERTRIQELTPPGPVEVEADGLLRPLVTVAGLGLVSALALALLVDNVMTSVGRRRSAPPEAEEGQPVEADGDERERSGPQPGSGSAQGRRTARRETVGGRRDR